MTSERFVPDPFDDAGARLYRTGDRVRLAASGELVFLGRVDQRVKLRGVRVEIGEIVATLRGLDGVADALVVLSTPSGAGTEMLIAYVVPKPGSNAPEAWKAALRRTLPDAMVPSVIVVLDAFPLTPNGKIDRQALRARSDVGATSGRVPSTSAERVVAKIWCAVLGRPKVFADEDFFAVGGNSLSGVMVINRLRETFRTDVPTRAIFERPTVERLVEALVEAWEGKPDIVEEIATLTLEVDALSDDEVNARLRG